MCLNFQMGCRVLLVWDLGPQSTQRRSVRLQMNHKGKFNLLRNVQLTWYRFSGAQIKDSAARWAGLSPCVWNGWRKMSKCRETVNGASIYDRSSTFGKETLSVGWEQGEESAGILLLSCDCFRQTLKTAPTTGLSSFLPTSFTSLEKIHSFSLLGEMVRQKLFQTGENGMAFIFTIPWPIQYRTIQRAWGLSRVALRGCCWN